MSDQKQHNVTSTSITTANPDHEHFKSDQKQHNSTTL